MSSNYVLRHTGTVVSKMHSFLGPKSNIVLALPTRLLHIHRIGITSTVSRTPTWSIVLITLEPQLSTLEESMALDRYAKHISDEPVKLLIEVDKGSNAGKLWID